MSKESYSRSLARDDTSDDHFADEITSKGPQNKLAGAENVIQVEHHHQQKQQPKAQGKQLKNRKRRKEHQSDEELAVVLNLVGEELADERGLTQRRDSTSNLVAQAASTSKLSGQEGQSNYCFCRSGEHSGWKTPGTRASGRRKKLLEAEISDTTSGIQESQKLLRRASADYSTCVTSINTSTILESRPNDRLSTTKSCHQQAGFSMPTIRLIPAYFIAELIGTFLLVTIGDGAIAAYVLTKRPIDIFCVCLAFGVGAMIATFASGRISGAHINPAASLAFALDGRLQWHLLPVYMLAQYIGGFMAALVLLLNYWDAINSLDGGQRSATGETNSTGGIFATYPATYMTASGSLLDQIIGTAVLLFSICAVTDKMNHGLEEKHQPLIVALVIGLICVAFSPNCGAIFNPARDLAPRLLTSIFGYPSVWSPIHGTYWILAGVVGPHIGAIIGVFTYKFTIGYALGAQDSFEQQSQQQQQQSQRQQTRQEPTNRDIEEKPFEIQSD